MIHHFLTALLPDTKASSHHRCRGQSIEWCRQRCRQGLAEQDETRHSPREPSLVDCWCSSSNSKLFIVPSQNGFDDNMAVVTCCNSTITHFVVNVGKLLVGPWMMFSITGSLTHSNMDPVSHILLHVQHGRRSDIARSNLHIRVLLSSPSVRCLHRYQTFQDPYSQLAA